MDLTARDSSDRMPSIHTHNAELIKFRDERKALVFTLTNGETLEGFVRWFDEETVHVVIAGTERAETTIFHHAVVRYQVR